MYNTKSFCNVSAFVKNDPNQNSVIGELTTQALTFSREVASFHHTTIDGYDLINFFSRNNDTKEIMRRTAVDQAVAFVDLCVRTTMGTSGEIFQDEIHRAIVALAGTPAIKANNIDTGPMVNDGTHWVPSWISWTDTNDTRENEHIVWLAVDDFMAEFPDWEIKVVTPVDNLDSFFNPGSMVEAMVKAITPTQMMERAENAKGGFPTTWRRSDPYMYYDPMNSSRKFDVYWDVLGWGDAGNDPDLIREEMVKYILANSTHTRDEWAVIFPDIFKRTEIVCTPLWDKYAADARVFDHGIYSPFVDNADTEKYAKIGAPNYAAAHVKTNAQIFAFPHRSIAIASIGHVENRDGKVKLSQLYPDYMAVPFQSTDAGRMSVETQAWVEKFLEMLLIAETWTSATRMPRGIYKITRNNKTYISATINRVLFLILVKSELSSLAD